MKSHWLKAGLATAAVGILVVLIWIWWADGDAEASGTVALIPTATMVDSFESISSVVTLSEPTVSQAVTSTSRSWVLSEFVEGPDPAPDGHAPAMVWFITHTDTDLDPTLLQEEGAEITPIEVRSTTGTVTARDPGSFAMLVWEEAPGVFARLRYGPSDDPVADALEIANLLIAVDESGWQEFSQTHADS